MNLAALGGAGAAASGAASGAAAGGGGFDLMSLISGMSGAKKQEQSPDPNKQKQNDFWNTLMGMMQ